MMHLKGAEKQHPPSTMTDKLVMVTDLLPKKLLLIVGLGIGGIIFIIRRRKGAGICGQDYRAFAQHFLLKTLEPPPLVPPSEDALKDLTFGVRDSFDVENYITGFGSPDWACTHGPASHSAPVVVALVQAGATCTGKTMMDEMGYSLEGVINEHYKTPLNPVANSRIVGGSSCGSAVAVSANLVDFAIGIDTIGDIRLPAACCGVLGFRSSHGAISVVGNTPTSLSLDTVGWFSKNPQILRQVGLVLLQYPLHEEMRMPRRIYVADDCFKPSTFLIEHSLDVFLRAVNNVYGRQILHHMDLGGYLTQKVPTVRAFHNDEARLVNSATGEGITLAKDCMLMVYRDDFIKSHHEWMDKVKPKFGRGVHGRVRASYQLTTSTHLVPTARRVKEEIGIAINELLKHDSLLVLPATPGLMPRLSANERTRERFQSDTSLFMCIATMSGCPAASVPTREVDGVPIAIQLVSRFSGDRVLLDALVALYPTMQEDARIVYN
ncbi:unnamed protein product [Calypogeia fissa]